MYPLERQRLILDEARTSGRVEVDEMSARLDVRPETIRRDLAVLHRRGMIRRVHGGALPIEGAGFEGALTARARRAVEEKERIAAAALPLIADADSVYLDEGSTVAAFAALIRPERDLTVVTNSLSIAVKLSQQERITVLMIGGRVRSNSLGVVDHWATGMLSGIVTDVAFMGANGITARRGLTCPDAAVAAVKATAINCSRRCVMLADHTKFGSDSFAVFGKITDLAALVTDELAHKSDLEPLRNVGVEIVRA